MATAHHVTWFLLKQMLAKEAVASMFLLLKKTGPVLQLAPKKINWEFGEVIRTAFLLLM